MAELAPSRRVRTHLVNEYGEAVRPRRSFLFRLIRALLVLGVVGSVLAAAGLLWFLHDQQRTPREWAPYLERRADRHNPVIVGGTALVADYLQRADRLDRAGEAKVPARIGAGVERSGPLPQERLREVAGIADLAAAVRSAMPGDVILLLPGHYRLEGAQMVAAQPGTATAPITVRATRLGDAVLDTRMVVAFKIVAPWWRFENLVIRGRCDDHRWCEHAFHVAAGATNVVIRNNRLEDLNAQIKVNGERGQFPDHGLIQGNTLVNTHPRLTTAPITPVDLVAASGWTISDNLIADFVRDGEGGATYGAFVKGAGEKNIIERNVVLCEWKLRGVRGQRIGLSLGGGGTGRPVMRDEGRSGFEQVGGVIRDNLIAFCSDVGIYVNRSARSVIEHNTLLDTAGIDVRFPESSAEVMYNLVDGVLRPRDGGVIRSRDNEAAMLLGLFLGWHPARAHFRNPAMLDLGWTTPPSPVTSDAAGRRDLCGIVRASTPRSGAFEDFAACP
ncbi:MAG: hypothetical protein AB7F35_05770 [Acetobacteraceae bacterium]